MGDHIHCRTIDGKQQFPDLEHRHRRLHHRPLSEAEVTRHLRFDAAKKVFTGSNRGAQHEQDTQSSL